MFDVGTAIILCIIIILAVMLLWPGNIILRPEIDICTMAKRV